MGDSRPPTRPSATARLRRIVATKAGQLAKTRAETLDDPHFDTVLAALQRGEIDFETAAVQVLELVVSGG